jgi:D-arabinose 1-dehydrogenase-like Zn-dependent alcohol dehydrogenase
VPHKIKRRAVGPNDVAIEIKYAGICHSDIHQAREEWGPAIFPMVPGHEIAGFVMAVGAKVKTFSVGDRVGVGCMVDSCRQCEECKKGEEQYCVGGGMIGTCERRHCSRQLLRQAAHLASSPLTARLPAARARRQQPLEVRALRGV